MTEQSENVEPPLARWHVQATLAVLAAPWLAWCLGNCISQPPHQVPPSSAAAVAAIARIEIDLNTAQPRELTLIPGVGPVLAGRIVDERRRRGGFSALNDLAEIHGIGPQTLRRLSRWCVVDTAPTDHRTAPLVRAAPAPP